MGFLNATPSNQKLDAFPHAIADSQEEAEALAQLVAMFRYESQCPSGWEISPASPLSRPGTIELAGYAVS
jgi:hypothetical protein